MQISKAGSEDSAFFVRHFRCKRGRARLTENSMFKKTIGITHNKIFYLDLL